MIDLRTELVAILGMRHVAFGILISIITILVSLAVVAFILVNLPPTYFQRSHTRDFWPDRHASIRWAGKIGKNLLGLALVLLGVIMSIPGVPGQGLLTILLGIMLLDFPGKRQLEYKIVSRAKVLAAINQIREKFSKPPLVLD